ncbi:MutS-related protein [Flavobacterium johnsoniae]|uniref:DNA mismatch repair protein MutS domain protein n=1 Tax=Flavobacterium johnsoniae (strain ATCC 17061 / DSM 2064 / JCM 8514 / BCRC 14874 / CCUG 350202 / NBRC 14942 / NCIMB 11054 / UW101) TaxID=376686 RepID=A5FGE2_FLAJ1|nr:DNA mismatch repair protein [Flavobacterium johnsoniae]ABQ05731.1 DNA mismatch repair protein MutS domain protein [Flavobacterium johnsoniae UW101]OXE95315.1 DNA mismatch repair protein [Flavobacterium johnsoniae UW101]WQG81468.1 DNA mismatch repair protein [Flavobacterium johnsoniae UW101]SHM05154.1 MutS domain V [Flavobacterium johnsoniae]
MEVYLSKVRQYSKIFTQINKRYNSISLLRLLSIFFCLFMLFYYIKTNEALYVLFAFLFFVGFLFLMRIHSKLSFQKELTKAVLKINEDEIAYLKREKLPFENGIEFNDFHHPYAYDLDIFGEHSLFQNLNRTATFIGKKTLANKLLNLFSNETILENQEAINELKAKIDWRQDFEALAIVSTDSKNSYDSLIHWISFKNNSLSKVLIALSIILPTLFFGFVIAYFITSKAIILSYVTYIFIFNLIVLGRSLKRIQSEIAKADNIDKTIKQYSLLVKKIELEKFESKKLIELQKQLVSKNASASSHLKQLSELFSRMETINNFVTATLFNGSFLFNLHVLKALLKWKDNYAHELEKWINIIGEFEALNSLANLSYNNPDFVFPEINSQYKIGFENLSHPLLNPTTRVGNDTYFYPQSFMILTGSNMSGKSTFLRSLGINMVLGGIGSVVCASKANIHPLPVLVSMRLSDSLADSESYFFAEIKRLKQIMDALEEGPAFVLLDEILRGTNSDDKRNGTIEVVKKVIAKNAIGAIATHDIEVCLTTNEYPDILTNQCFEVEIQNNELHFDYKLRSGICQNRSATFLMQKMGVI